MYVAVCCGFFQMYWRIVPSLDSSGRKTALIHPRTPRQVRTPRHDESIELIAHPPSTRLNVALQTGGSRSSDD